MTDKELIKLIDLAADAIIEIGQAEKLLTRASSKINTVYAALYEQKNSQ